MLGTHHGYVTLKAFSKIFSGKGVDLVRVGSRLADEVKLEGWGGLSGGPYHGEAWKKQHFSLQKNKDVREGKKKAYEFLESVKEDIVEELNYSTPGRIGVKQVIAGVKPLDPWSEFTLDYVLYCLGRACHCVQDFYAHSNWVIYKYSICDMRCWNLSLKDLMDLNIIISRYDKKAEDHYGKLIYKKNNYGECVKTMKKLCIPNPRKPVTHGEMNLDSENSWAAYVCKKLADDKEKEFRRIGDESYWGGWVHRSPFMIIAINNAVESSLLFWNKWIVPEVENHKLQLLRAHEPKDSMLETNIGRGLGKSKKIQGYNVKWEQHGNKQQKLRDLFNERHE